MSNETKVTLNKGGSEEKTLPISQITIPDLWHIAEAIRKNGKVADGPGCAALILECWNLAHDLKNHVKQEREN